MEHTIVCNCSETTIAEAIRVFQHTDLPYLKARKLVTKCSRTCCNKALIKLFDMVEFGKFDLEEIVKIINQT